MHVTPERYREIQTPNHAVSGGNKVLEKIEHRGAKYLTIQVNFTGLDQSDGKIKLYDSLDGINFAESLDSAGNPIEVTLTHTLSSAILRVIDFFTDYIRVEYVNGTSITGTIDELLYTFS